MKFNTNLIPSGVDEDLAKMLLSILFLDIEVKSSLILKDTSQMLGIRMDFNEDLIGSLQDVVRAFEKAGTIIRSYDESDKHRWKLVRPFMVTEIIELSLEDKFIKKCRSYFQYSYCGVRHRASTTGEVRKHLTIFLENNPKIDKSKLPEVFEMMVQERMMNNPDFVPKIIKFINSVEDEGMNDKDLKYYYGEYEESGRAEGNFIN